MAIIDIKVTLDDSAADVASGLVWQSKKTAKDLLEQFDGCDSVELAVQTVDSAKASGTITFSGIGAANDTVLVNGVTFTAKTSGATGNEWNVGASATASGDNLAAAIVASTSALVNKHVTAAAATGVVTITSVESGYAGNAVTIAEGVDGSSHMTVSGARLTGGSKTARSYSFNNGDSV